MQDLATDARTILSALGSELPAVDAEHPILAAADRLADAADDDDPARCSAGIRALFAGVIEPLGDGFSAAGRELYGLIFARILWRCCQRREALANALSHTGIADQQALHQRYLHLLHQPRPCPERANTILVLSRVTVGADVLLTTILLQHLHQRYPDADLVVAGDPKLGALIGDLPGVRVAGMRYARRGPLGKRLGAWLALRDIAADERPDFIVAADSRLDQLGLLPVADVPVWLWPTLRNDDDRERTLAQQLDAACAADFGTTPGVTPALGLASVATASGSALKAALGEAPIVAVKLDHGGNPAKALPRPGEIKVLKQLERLGWRILIDRGFGDEEFAASDALMAELDWQPHDLTDLVDGSGTPIDDLTPNSLASAQVIRFHGSIAGWAAAVGNCQLALSYDSVGQHLAAAMSVPTVVIFTGHPHSDFTTAWTPARGPDDHAVVIADGRQHEPASWERVLNILPAAR